MSLINRGDIDGDEIRVGSLNINYDGEVRLRTPGENWVSLSSSIDEELRTRFSSNLVSASELRNSIANDWLDQGIFSNRRLNTFNPLHVPGVNVSPDLTFLDMKIENLGDQFKTIITYIDKKNYQEVKKEYYCGVSFTQEFNLSDNNKLNIEISQYGEITETRKDI